MHLVSIIGLTLTECDCLLRLYGNEALAAVKSDPYLLTPIIGFERADKISGTISTDVTSCTRLAALCTWVISEYARETGSSLISETELKKRLSKFTKSPVEAIAAGKRGLQLKQTRRLITTSAFHQMETHIRQWLTDIEAANELNFHNYEIKNELDLYTSIQRVEVSVEQCNAISLTLTQNISCIDIRSKDSYKETLDALQWVFNRLIGGQLFTFSPDPNTPHCICTEELQKAPPDIPKNALIIVEGSSALDVPSAFKLTKLKITNSKLVFIGNSTLSNSAGYGNLYHQAIRYFPTSEIAANRHSGVNRTERLSGTQEFIAKKIIDNQCTVACYSSEDATAINRIVQTFKHPNLLTRYITINEMPFYIGDPVIFTKSIHDLGIYRGQRATFEDKKGLFLNFRLNGTQVSLTYHQAISAGLRLGYAIWRGLTFSENYPTAIIRDKTIKKDKKVTTQRLVPIAF